MNNTLILLYHDIIRLTKNLHIYDVSLDEFKLQMELLKVLISNGKDNGNAKRSHHLLNGQNVILSFDDGYKIWAQEVLDVLNAFNLKAYFFICIKNINDASILKCHIKTLHKSGMVIGSHSVTHRFMHKLSEKEIHKEMSESKRILEDIIGEKVEYFSVPRGVHNDSVIRIAKEVGYKHVFTSQVGINERFSYELKRIAVKRDVCLGDFKDILDGVYLEQMVIEQKIKDKAKTLLGIERYNQLRRVFVPRAEKK